MARAGGVVVLASIEAAPPQVVRVRLLPNAIGPMNASRYLYRTLRFLKRRVGPPYRVAQRWACRVMFERGQLDTARRVDLDEVGLGAAGRMSYLPSGWFYVHRALRGASITADDVLVDFGSGMGRAVLIAAHRYPFRRVIGVEISPELNFIAMENLCRTRHKLRCLHVTFIIADAVTYTVPDDMTYAYFFHPFADDIFRAVVRNIIASLDRRHRRVTICYANPVMDAAIIDSGRFVRWRTSKGLRPEPWYHINVYRSI